MAQVDDFLAVGQFQHTSNFFVAQRQTSNKFLYFPDAHLQKFRNSPPCAAAMRDKGLPNFAVKVKQKSTALVNGQPLQPLPKLHREQRLFLSVNNPPFHFGKPLNFLSPLYPVRISGVDDDALNAEQFL
ncbi:hypothetical protein B0813_000043 [Candidatus Fervidibacteria bacterium JGI MDM2 SSWTFF-3-K9]